MDAVVAARLDSRKGNPHYDARFSSKLNNTARAYIESGVRVSNFYYADFDAATDLVDMFQNIGGDASSAANFAKADRNSALYWRHPATFTQMHVLTTFIAEILYGSKQARSVEAQGEDDAKKADDINALLAWNDAKIRIYNQGWLHTWNALVYNRGVWYERGGQDEDVVREPVEEDDITKPMVPLLRKDGTPRMTRSGEPIMGYPKRQRMRNKIVRSGFFNALDLVSPYDFICDPAKGLVYFQEGRYAGHRVWIPWHQLKTRSELEPEDDQYVLPHTVWKVKNAGTNAIVPASLGGTPGLNPTRTAYNRTLRGGGTAVGGIGGNGVGAGAGVDGVNKDDGGVVECFVLYVRERPKSLLMYDDEEFEIVQLLVTAGGDILSAQVQPNKHNQFPYAPGEGLPNAFQQFTPGWGLRCKPVQDHMDNLNTQHNKMLARMGMILGVDDTKCDVSNLLSPDKVGLLIQKREAGSGIAWDEIIHQIPQVDTTANFPEEMKGWKETMQDMTGSSAYVQGQTEDPEQTLGQFDAVRQMATGRISSIARLLSEQCLVPQTSRFVQNLQQFMSEEQTIRITNNDADYDPLNPAPKYKTIKKIDIQGQFDVIPHDGSLPGADAKIVAAAARTIEAYSQNPQLASAFSQTQPGAINLVALLRDLLKKSGLQVEKYTVSLREAQQNQQQQMQAQGIYAPQTNGAAPINGATPPGAPMVPTTNGGIPSAGTLPANPTAAPSRLNGLTS